MKKGAIRITAATLVVALGAAVMIGCDQKVEDDPPYVGVWRGLNQQINDDPVLYADVTIALNADMTYSTYIYAPGTADLQTGSTQGKYAIGNAGELYGLSTRMYDGSAWVDTKTASYATYSVDGDTLRLVVDISGAESGFTWTLARQ